MQLKPVSKKAERRIITFIKVFVNAAVYSTVKRVVDSAMEPETLREKVECRVGTVVIAGTVCDYTDKYVDAVLTDVFDVYANLRSTEWTIPQTL